jgi:tetratricopeptide (TPR) repeat protein
MMRKLSSPFLFSISLVLLISTVTIAQEKKEGQPLLDQATELKLDAKSFDDLEKVADLCEEAIKKGLDKENTAFARQLMSASLFERASRLSAPALTNPPDRRWPAMRDLAMADLDRLLKYNPRFGDALLLVARLQLLPGGDREKTVNSIKLALEIFAEDKEKLAGVYVLRSQLQNDPKARLADLDKAIELDPDNTEILQQRAFSLIQSGKMDEAVEDLRTLFIKDPENIVVAAALVEYLGRNNKPKEALEIANEVVKRQPKDIRAYQMRSRVHLLAENIDGAIEDLGKALEIEPRSLEILLTRATVYESIEKYDEALADLTNAEKIRPGLPQAALLRGMIYQRQERFDDAALQLRRLVRLNPGSAQLRLQLGLCYSMGDHHQLAIEEFSRVIEIDKKSWIALYSRGDTQLNIGKHKEAISDYNAALQLNKDSEGLLNNFAWVLATSPVDELRDGKRAVELAEKACKMSEYKKPHILSTLAAAYAETGDFESAIKWSSKAVEISQEDIQDQLKAELKSYKKGKPFRELKEDEEGPPVKKEKPVT